MFGGGLGDRTVRPKIEALGVSRFCQARIETGCIYVVNTGRSRLSNPFTQSLSTHPLQLYEVFLERVQKKVFRGRVVHTYVAEFGSTVVQRR